ncbi:MAG: hypothetical protein HYT39_02835 [Candidatus Sungbacteria bacterium]|nr:hypothetical protein [Candidatus Sungbacteria bacterium]
MRLRTIREMRSTSGRKLTYFLMKLEDSINIDNPIDFELAGLILRRRLGDASWKTGRSLLRFYKI